MPKLPEPTGAIATDWLADPFSWGAYSKLLLGATGDEMAQLQQPVEGNLFLAGEAAHAHDSSTVHGAWQSGHRAAEQVAASFAIRFS